MKPIGMAKGLIARLLSVCLLAFLAVLPTSIAAKTVALVVQKAATEQAIQNDAMVKARLEKLGYRVLVLDQADPASAAATTDGLLISSSCSAGALAYRYRDYPKPIILWEPAALPYMGMTGLKEETDYGSVDHLRFAWMVNAPHPLSARQKAGLTSYYTKNAPVNWGKPGLGATIIATIPGEPEKVLEFSYEKGATMDYQNIAPGRRTFIFLDATFGNLNDVGLALFDAAVSWSVDTPQ